MENYQKIEKIGEGQMNLKRSQFNCQLTNRGIQARTVSSTRPETYPTAVESSL